MIKKQFQQNQHCHKDNNVFTQNGYLDTEVGQNYRIPLSAHKKKESRHVTFRNGNMRPDILVKPY